MGTRGRRSTGCWTSATGLERVRSARNATGSALDPAGLEGPIHSKTPTQEKGRAMKQQHTERSANSGAPLGGLAAWLLARLRVTRHAPPRLAVLERIALAPRQSLALVEAEGRRFLVATSPEGTPAIYALDESARRSAGRNGNGPELAIVPPSAQRSARVSW